MRKKLSEFLYQGWGQRHFHYCPAYEKLHGFSCDMPQMNGARWKFDGNAEKPTFTPSMNITSVNAESGKVTFCCHYTLILGKIQYQSDCTHAMAGKMVDLPPLPENLISL